MGVGNFLGAKTDFFSDSKVSGTELDSISGRIAKQLYPEAKVEIGSFEHTKYRDDSFDVAIGNVPFGDTKIFEPKEQKKLNIHDYFFAKSLDKVKTGGIVAVITSKGTMDKKDSSVREYLSQRADLLGAIRLPNTAFKSNAGTEVTSDIIFLQKREAPPEVTPDWVHIGKNGLEVPMNQYYIDNPDMIMGRMAVVSGRFGDETTCFPDRDIPLKEQLAVAMKKLGKPDLELLKSEISKEKEAVPVPEVPENTRNHSFVVIDNEVYFNRFNALEPQNLKPEAKERVMAMVELVEQTRNVIELQVSHCSDEELHKAQATMLHLHEEFHEKFGVFAHKDNKAVFQNDSSYPLLKSLETLDKEGNLIAVADIFLERTIKPTITITSVDTPVEALAVSISEKAMVDIPFMAQLMGGEHKAQEVIDGLQGVIFKEPTSDLSDPLVGWKPADEYLSGNVRKKLEIAKSMVDVNPELALNVEMLEKVQPKELEASEISVKLGSTWVPPEIYTEFMFHLLETSKNLQSRMDVEFAPITGQWGIRNRDIDKGSTIANSVFGSGRKSAYEILENALNQKDTKVFDSREIDGKKVYIYNKKESDIVESCQKRINSAFDDWVWDSAERREKLTHIYNEAFNSTRPREFDGSHIKFEGMTDKIQLNQHQVNAVARTLYGGNSLLAHCVGAGKTFTMIASAMEGKRLGLHNKTLITVPNHLTSQIGADIYKLYPNANILVADSDDFNMDNRKEMCAKIATGNFDIVVIGHSQLIKIPLSPERLEQTINVQVEQISQAIREEKRNNGQSFTVKNLERKKREIQGTLKKLVNEKVKDDVVTFEEMGIDKIFIDEAHKFKNLFLASKMTNVAGINSNHSQRATDLLTKCQYLDEITGGKGTCFATGTPLSNSMSEMYTLMKFLQNSTLEDMNLQHFDSWASTFCVKTTDQQLTPTGEFKEKTRFSTFHNIPELVTVWKEVADIQTEDMLDLPTPEFEYETVLNMPTEYQEWYINELSERADDVEMKLIDRKLDSMGIITMDGRRIALDQRLEDERLPDELGSKVNVCVEKVAEVWEETAENKSTQLIFLDQGVPHFDGTFSLYEDIRDKLVEKGIPKEQVTFIHEAKDTEEKENLFAKVRNGDVRVLLGSTEKMGAGTNCQKLLIALHHLDIPWKPSDIQQREGRILRQGNENPKVKIFKYVTKGTFDSYSWSVMENKQKFIGQVFTSKSPVRSMDDLDETALTYAETKAIATGDERIKEKMELQTDVSKLKVIRSHHATVCHRLEDKTIHHFPQAIRETQGKIKALHRDLNTLAKSPAPVGDNFRMVVDGITHSERKTAGEAILQACSEMKANKDTQEPSRPLGEFRGFETTLTMNNYGHFAIDLKNDGLTHGVKIEASALGSVTRICNKLDMIEENLNGQTYLLERLEKELATALVECKKPFSQEEEYQDKTSKLEALNQVLGGDKKSRTSEEIQGRIEAQATRLSNKEAKIERKEEQKEVFKVQKKAEKAAEKEAKSKKAPKKKKQAER